DTVRATTFCCVMLRQRGLQQVHEWPCWCSCRLGLTYLFVEQSPDMTSCEHERTRAGLNHLAFHAGRGERLDELVERAPTNGWHQLFAEQYPHAGGRETYAAYLVNTDGFEVELVAEDESQ